VAGDNFWCERARYHKPWHSATKLGQPDISFATYTKLGKHLGLIKHILCELSPFVALRTDKGQDLKNTVPYGVGVACKRLVLRG
jgi:hypothetical protein